MWYGISVGIVIALCYLFWAICAAAGRADDNNPYLDENEPDGLKKFTNKKAGE